MAASKATLVLFCFVLPAAIESEGYFKRHFEVGNVKIGRGDKTRGRAINRIVGGVEVTPHSHPYQVGLYIHTASGNFICGATLLSTKYVLTAAHCLDDADKIDVILGAHNIYDQDEIGQVRVSTGKFVQHENWTPSGFLNDIGVVELPVSVNLTESVSSVVLPRYSNVNVTFENRTGTVMGWGRISDEPWGVAEVLQSVNATVMSNERCKEVFDIVGDVHMCTSGDGIKGTCMGDSGGPLIVDGVQVGIVSFGSQYCELGFPSAYTRVTHFLHWISQNSDVQINP